MTTQANFNLFSFNTSKSPEKHSEDVYFKSAIEFKDYDNQNTYSDFLRNLKDFLSQMPSMEEILSHIDDYKKNDGNYLSSKIQVNESLNRILDLYTHLSKLDKKFQVDQLQDDIIRISGVKNISDWFEKHFVIKWSTVWDSLVIELILPSPSTLRKDLINALQTLKLIKAYSDGKIDSIETLTKILNAIPVIPNGILPLHFDLKSEQNQESSDALKAQYEQELKQINAMEKAKSEILLNEEKYRRLAVDLQKTLKIELDGEGLPIPDPKQPELINISDLTESRIAELSAPTKQIVDSLGKELGNQKTYKNIINIINNSISSLYASVYSAQFATKTGIFNNGVLYSNGTPNLDIGIFDIWNGSYTPTNSFEQCRVKPLGISDYRKVEANWKRYEAGEIAHIENVLKGEFKDRETRHLRSVEDTYTYETIKENETIRDLQTTDRFALQKEASKIVQQDFEANVDAYVKGSYGAVSFGVSGGVSYSQSTTNSQMEASQYAKEVVDRSISRILESTREERTVRILEEFEEKNVHKLDNIGGADHIVGVYRWVDKIMQCKLANYGKRLLFEFMVPEPAAFHIFAKARKTVKGVYVEKPIHPNQGIQNPITNTTIYLNAPQQLTEANYKVWAAAFGASVEPYPINIDIGKSFTDSLGQIPSGQWLSKAGASNDFKIPDGYIADTCEIRYMNEAANNHSLVVAIGDININSWSFGNGGGYGGTFVLDKFSDIVPVSWYFNSTSCAAFNIVVHCKPSETTIAEWQLATFNAIVDAYNKKLTNYNNAIIEAQVSQGILIEGNNPLINREIEKNELKKACIQLMTSNNFYSQFNAMKHSTNGNAYPYFNNCEAIDEGHIVKFIESILDWDIMSYYFHPYFWGNRNRWVEIYNTSSLDPLHTSFLQAGYARVVIPVRLGFENIAMQFSETGLIDYDTSAWVATSPEAIDANIELGQNTLAQAPPSPADPGYTDWLESELNPDNWPTWEARLPTNLVILQKSCPVDSATALPENNNI